MKTRVALIAHDHKKDDIVRLTGEYVDTLSRCELVATGTTGGRIEAAHALKIERLLSGSARRRSPRSVRNWRRAAWTW